MKEKGCRVRLERVVERFGEVVAVDRVSLKTAPGEFLTLLGSGGSGKTTILKIIAGLINRGERPGIFDDVCPARFHGKQKRGKMAWPQIGPREQR